MRMVNAMKKHSYLCKAICLILVIAMTAAILPEPVWADSNVTLDLIDPAQCESFQTYGKAGKGGVDVVNSTILIPEGQTLYIKDSRQTCSGQQICRVYYKGIMWQAYSNNIIDLKSTKYIAAYTEKWGRTVVKGEKLKVKKTVLVGSVKAPSHSYFLYAYPKLTAENRIGVLRAGESVQVLNENYNSKWAEILWGECIAYIQKEYLNNAESYLAGIDIRSQQDIMQAKKVGLTYKDILKKYDYALTKKEFCRLAVNWYKAIGKKLPKQKKKSPYTDTKDSYVIMAHQLGIIKSTASKKFKPNHTLTCGEFNKMINQLLTVTKQKKLYPFMRSNNLNSFALVRKTAIRKFYHGYKLLQKKDYLIPVDYSEYYFDYENSNTTYIIAPVDNQKICLDVWGQDKSVGAEIRLYEKNGGGNQLFYLYNVNGFTILKNLNSHKTVNGTSNKVYQDRNNQHSEKMTFEYNNDGTISIKNGNGLYLDIQGGEAVSGAHLMFAPKSGSSTQKFVFTLVDKTV